MNGGDVLTTSYAPEAKHRPLASPDTTYDGVPASRQAKFH